MNNKTTVNINTNNNKVTITNNDDDENQTVVINNSFNNNVKITIKDRNINSPKIVKVRKCYNNQNNIKDFKSIETDDLNHQDKFKSDIIEGVIVFCVLEGLLFFSSALVATVIAYFDSVNKSILSIFKGILSQDFINEYIDLLYNIINPSRNIIFGITTILIFLLLNFHLRHEK